ncbi:potassium channel family protein [Candidatus Aalborgicola defluviihabitans]|uniref:potassium channel family protein n=1 Tax=Candidatus Aalborgicola defluviihabitans TaxID=3386187 RepID=UPI001ECF8452|nr:potassium channel protein [Burkholderiales bacterium]MBL0243753.1 potassium channel protein [Rhodoferax sp.]
MGHHGLEKVFRSRHFKGLVYGVALLLVITAMGTLGYHYIGRPSATWIDSFYMTFITIATIGFGETVDLSAHPMGRLFTVFIAIIGIGTLSYLFSTLVALLIDSDLNAELRKKRMEKQIAQMKGHYIVCGIGRVGSNVAHELAKTRRSLVVIERDRAVLDTWLEHHPHALYLHDDAADDDALRRAGLSNATGVFAVTGDDSHNLMVALSVKLLSPKVRVVVRLHDIRNTNKARRAGADEIVSPDFTGGMRIASAMVRPHVVNFMDQMLHSDEGQRVEQVVVPDGFDSKPLAELVPKSKDYLLMALHEHGNWVFNPSDDHMVNAGTALVLMTSPEGRMRVEKLFTV